LVNFETYYLISIPGFVVGIMTARFFSGRYWQSIRSRLGGTARLVGGLFFLVYLVSIPLILGIMLIYLIHLPSAQPSRIAVTLLAGLWVVANFVLEIANLVSRRSPKPPSETGTASSTG
jgi:hypothetical protein